MVEAGMRVGLGTGSTVAYLLVELARRNPKAVHVATSPRTADAARELGIVIEPFNVLDRLDLCIDGADQIATCGWLIKGGGGAQTREKVVAASADRFIVIADSWPSASNRPCAASVTPRCVTSITVPTAG
jgi:ribose 5-phosphate isomerase A